MQIEKGFPDSDSWYQIANVPVTPTAQTGTTPVSQSVYLNNLSGGWVRCRIVANGTPSAWCSPVQVLIVP
ncbi:MAG: hypothetical protein H8F28_25095 [Fibrella sp.]|nr:hypothetical protein [Armatimonadota bacterium]